MVWFTSEMPEFFVPRAESPEQAEEIWQAIKQMSEAETGWAVTDRRIFRVEYRHNGRDEWAEVGEVFRFGDPGDDGTCVAILESNSFLVCTPRRGVVGGLPYLIGVPASVVEFDGPKPQGNMSDTA